MKRKRPGGLKQRLQRAAAEDAPIPMQSVLAAYLLQRMAWGFLSPQEVQTMASLAKQDIEMSANSTQPLDELSRLAAVGNHGAHPSKCFSDILRKHGQDNQLPEAHLLKVPLKGHADDVLQGMILPHELFSAIYNFYPDTWSRSILPDNDMDNLENFWSAVDGHPSLTHHIRSKPGYKRTLVPLGLHGDGVPLTGRGKVWQQGFTNFSFFSLVGQGNTGELLFYIWGLFEKLKYLEHEANSTLTRAFAILRWSFQALFEGVWPSRNHLGELLLVCELPCCLESFCRGVPCLEGFL